MQNENKAGGVLLKLHLDASGNHEIKDGQIKFIKYSNPDEKIFIKDMVSSRDDSTTLILMMYNFLTRKFAITS
ncbi:hypothetical protein [Pedobacter alluvionis]|uniref:Uncharacterized protein n=1 Tax=Pedobacter alluvionis TaxID=475253 RepID=A0A497Y2Z2_9SPHI|nr:hypothetical protein [Pedobacter alluvionis]RLJ74837.1 hypothetical protein BCL90_3180 [Pedobacter alluvionis]TFB29968.1 hypothetical protein E3V97_17455 [Pedobacter alluvionis]